MNPVEIARLAAGILNVNNLSKENISAANQILEDALVVIRTEARKAMAASAGIIS